MVMKIIILLCIYTSIEDEIPEEGPEMLEWLNRKMRSRDIKSSNYEDDDYSDDDEVSEHEAGDQGEEGMYHLY
jgi:hypothetical protein